MHDIITAGSASEDLFIQVDDVSQARRPLQEGFKYHATDVVHAFGGGALNTAHALKTLGHSAAPWSIRGDDCIGTWLNTALTLRHVPTTYLSVEQNQPSAQSFILPSTSGNRTIISYRGCTELLDISGIHEHLPELKGLLLCSLPHNMTSHIPALLSAADRLQVPVATNPGMHQLASHDYVYHLLHALRSLALCSMNDNELQTFARTLATAGMCTFQATHTPIDQHDKILIDDVPYTIRDIISALTPYIHGWFVVTRGAHGLFAYTDGFFYACPAQQTKAISSVGAGDTHIATLFSCRLRSIPFERALLLATAHSTRVLTQLGACNAHTDMPTLEHDLLGHTSALRTYAL